MIMIKDDVFLLTRVVIVVWLGNHDVLADWFNFLKDKINTHFSEMNFNPSIDHQEALTDCTIYRHAKASSGIENN